MERNEADILLWEKLPNWMTDTQKKHKINNLIAALSRKGKIKNIGTYSQSKWVLLEVY
jgi:ATP-dependent DNA helicase RecG